MKKITPFLLIFFLVNCSDKSSVEDKFFEITFQIDDDTTYQKTSVKENTKIEKPNDPTKTGYTFENWYKDSELTQAFNFNTELITSNITLYPKWDAIQTGGSMSSAGVLRNFQHINEKTSDFIAVYGTSNVTTEQYNRVYASTKKYINQLDSRLKTSLLNSNSKLLVLSNEQEIESNDFFLTLTPAEAIYVNNGGVDESLPSSTDVNLPNTELELNYLIVYYALLTESSLSTIYSQLKSAYNQARITNIFTPAAAYLDSTTDDTHMNASSQNALKYGSYLFNLYKLYFGNGMGAAGEFTITTKAQLMAQNRLGFDFMETYFTNGS